LRDFSVITFNAALLLPPKRTGQPLFIIPDLCSAISSIVSPRKAEWSSSTFVITESRGASITFVESVSPPSPHSITATSHFFLLKNSKAAAVVISNSVGGLSIASATGIISLIKSAKSLSDISLPPSCILSFTLVTNGDEKSPVLYPCALSMHESIFVTEPFPLVPVTWISFTLLCGLSIRSRSSVTLDSPRQLPRFEVNSRYFIASSYVIIIYCISCRDVMKMLYFSLLQE